MKTIRKILRGVEEGQDGYFRITNEDAYSVYIHPAIGMIVKTRRLQWLDDTERMEEERTLRE